MPLAHLRYYGGAVSSQRTLGFKITRVFFDRIVLVTIGSAIAGSNNSDAELDSAMHFFIAIADILKFFVSTENSDYSGPKSERIRLVRSFHLINLDVKKWLAWLVLVDDITVSS